MPIARTHALFCLATLSSIIACAGSGTVTPPGVDSTGKDIFTRGAEVLTWTQAQKVAYYPKMDSIFPAHVAARGTVVHDLPTGAPLAALTSTPAAVQALNDFIVAQQVVGLLVIQRLQALFLRVEVKDTSGARRSASAVRRASRRSD